MAEKAEKGTESAEKAYAAAAADAKPAKVPAPESNKLPRKPAAKAAPKKAVVKPKPAEPAATPASAPALAEIAEPALPVVEAPAALAVEAEAEAAPVAEAQAAPVAEAEAPAAETVEVAAPEPVIAPKLTVTELKEKIMASAKTPDYTQPIADAFGEIQTRAKAAYEKSTEAFSEATEFAKGNVEALVESGKILAGGVQDFGKDYAEDAKSAYETFTADIKEAAAVKSPTELFQLQGKIFRRNFDSLVAAGSKNTEALVKLANDAFAPLSGRVNLAAEKLSKAA